MNTSGKGVKTSSKEERRRTEVELTFERRGGSLQERSYSLLGEEELRALEFDCNKKKASQGQVLLLEREFLKEARRRSSSPRDE